MTKNTQFSVTIRGRREHINVGGVEQGIPLPPKSPGRKLGSGMFPYSSMGAGDSFYVSYCDGETKPMASSHRTVMRNRISSSTRRREKMHPNEKYATRADFVGVRVWRTA